MKKLILIAIVIILVAAAAAGLYLFKNLDEIVRRATERVLSYVLQVDVEVGGVDVALREARVTMRDLKIPNPPGFKTDHAMKFGLIEAQVDIQSFRTAEPTIHLIRLEQANIQLELSREGSNLQRLQQNASRLKGEEAAPDKPAESKKQFKIAKLQLAGNQVAVAIPMLEGYSGTIPLPDIELENLGGRDGLQPHEILAELLAAILGQLRSAGEGVIPQDLLGNVTSLGTELREKARETIGKVGEELEGAGDELRNAVEGIGENLPFGRKKEEPAQ